MNDTEQLADELSELFRENVTVGDVTQREFGGARISVTTMSYRSRSSSGDTSKYYEQTAVILDDQHLDLPEFSLSPRVKGLLGKLLSLAGNLAAIEFDDSPEFSQRYFLHGWADKPVRILFTKDIRDHFSTHPDWSVRGKKNRLVIFKTNQVCAAAEIDEFTRQSLEILALFQAGEEELDARPDVRRDTRPEDVSRAASQMGGLVGAMLQKQLNKIAVTRAELNSFVASSVPREIPPGLKRQVLGETFPLIIVGLVFVIIGLVGGTLWILLAEGMVRLLGIPFLIFFPVIGCVMSGLTIRFRRRKNRLLAQGILTQGTVKSIQQSSVVVNNQRRFHAELHYNHQGRDYTTHCNVYGTSVDQLRALQDSGESTQLLVDPEDQRHVISLDQLIVFE